jgi:spore coat protein A
MVLPLEQLLMMPAERSDVIVDFSGLENGTEIYIINEGPDEPFGGGVPGTDFPFSDPATTGQIMKFVVDNSLLNAEGSTDGTASMPAQLQLAPRQDLVPNAPERRVSLNEEESTKVCVQETMDGGIEAIPDLAPADPDTPGDVERFVADCQDAGGFPFGPTEALVGTVAGDAGIGFSGVPLHWTDMTGASTWVKVFTQSDGSPVMAPVTEMPDLNAVEVWEIFNFTADAHPIHLHLVQFQVVNRQDLTVDEEGVATQPAMYVGGAQAPEAWESGWKDTVVAYPGQVTRIQARFDIAGLYVWHCHIIDHEDNEMMRPYAVIPDIDGNGCVDRADYMAILQDIRSGAGQYDLNGDGVVNIADARRVILFFTNPRGAACQPPD